MRVTEGIKQNASMSNILKTNAEVNKYSENIATGRRILTPSDDPVNSVKGEEKIRELKINESIANNINTGKNLFDIIDFTLEEATDVLREAKVLTVQSANGHMTNEALTAAGIEMDSLLDRLVDLTNTKIGKSYLFSGTKSLTEPIVLNQSGKIGDIFHPGSVWKTNIPLDSKTPEEQRKLFAKEGEINIKLSDEQGKVYQLNIVLNDVNSVNDLVTKINQGIQDHYNKLPENEQLATDSAPLAIAQIGSDLALYIEGKGSNKISEIQTNLFTSSGIDFEILKDKDWVSYPNPVTDKNSPYTKMYGEKLGGNPSKDFTIKIIEEGSIGTAKFMILDNERNEVLSQPQTLGIINEILDPAEETNSLKLNFQGGNTQKTYFAKGLEFRFYPSEFASYKGNNEVREIPLDGGKRLSINVNAGKMFFKTNGKGVNFFDVLKNARDAMYSSDQEKIAQQLDFFDTGLSQLLEARAKAGIGRKEMDVAEQRVMDSNITNQENLSELVDQDFAEAATSLSRTKLKQEATYDVTSKMIQPGLINFLS